MRVYNEVRFNRCDICFTASRNTSLVLINPPLFRGQGGRGKSGLGFPLQQTTL